MIRLGCLLRDAEDVGHADAGPVGVRLGDAEVVEDRELVAHRKVVGDGRGGGGALARVPLIHPDHHEVGGELAQGVDRAHLPEVDLAVHPAGREAKEGEALAEGLVMDDRPVGPHDFGHFQSLLGHSRDSI